MIAQYGKRVLSFFLAMIMILSAVPVQVFAEETHDHTEEGIVVASETGETPGEPIPSEPIPSEPTPSEPTPSEPTPSEPTPSEPTPSEPTPSEPTPSEPTPSVPTPTESGESEGLIALRAAIADYINTYGLTADMPDSVLANVYFALNGEQAQAAWFDVEAMVEQGMALPLAERELLLKEQNSKLVKRFYEVMQSINNPVLLAEAQTFKPVTGVSVQVSKDYKTATMSDGKVIVTATGTTSCGGGVNEVTITIANDSGKKANISFSWDKGTCTVRNDALGTASPYTKTFAADETIQFTVQSPKGNNTGTFTLSNFACEVVAGTNDVTFIYEDARGTVKHNGETVANGAVVPVASSGAALKAVPSSGYSFIAWVDENNKLISKEASWESFTPDTAMTVKAVFAGTEPVFLVDDSYIVNGLNEALAKGKKVVLMNNATLPAGDYTIPSGKTLLIPYNDANTLCTTKPTILDTYSAPKIYRTLTMASGANLVVNGALSISGQEAAKQGNNGFPTAAVGKIAMNQDSTITVNGGGNLYAWGYITGSGTVELKSSASAYENFHLTDWRGGSMTLQILDNSQRVFPMNQYSVRNVEVPMTINSGAIVYTHMSVNVSGVGIQDANVEFIHNDKGMFRITSGYIVKSYQNGRMVVDIHGDVGMAPLKVSVKLSILGSKTIDSASYTLPVNGLITVNVLEGNVNITQDLAIHPGAQLYIAQGAKVTLASGKKVYVYDRDSWDAAFAYGKTNPAVSSADGTICVDGTIDASAGQAYTTGAGANIYSNGTGQIIINAANNTDKQTYQFKQSTEEFVPIGVTSAKLKNTDGTYTETVGDTGKVIYLLADGKWTCAHTYAKGTYVENVTSAATCEKAGAKTLTCNCGDHSKTEEIAALGHAYKAVVTAPTCTTDGYTTYTCKNDPTHKYTDTPVAALGHTAGAAATCTTAQTCTVCGAEMVAALGHDEVAHEAMAPTCTENGWDAYVTCSRCDYTTYVEKTSLGHDEVAHEAKVPTCTEVGWDAYVTCNRCDYSTYVEKAVLPHSWEWITDEDATVLNPGVKHEECSVCHAKQNENTEIPVLKCPHTGTMTITPAKDSTCSETGNTRYSYCSACQNYYSDDAGQHEIEKDSWIIAAKGHAEVDHAAQDPTCTEIGWDAYVTCARCDYSTYAEKAALGHAEVTHAAKNPTCTEIGWDAYVACTRCSYTTKVEKPAKGHGPMEEVAAVAATCQKEGIVAHWRCTACGMTFEDQAATKQLESVAAPIDPQNHTWAEKGEETKATCRTEGKIVYPCVNEGCEETNVVTLPVDPEGHVWDEGVPFGNHSCNSASYMIYTCTLCQVENKVVVEEQHFRVPIAEEIPATCTEDGMTSGWKCEKCHEFWIPQEVIPALGHDWNGNIPCQSDASACTRCDLHFETRQEHLVVVDSEVPATCTETGLTEGSHCGYCGEVLVAQTVIPAIEHNWIVTNVEIPATCGTAGHRAGARYCMDCDYDANPIPALEHEWMHRDAKNATYSAIGWNAHDYCLMCKTVKTLEQYAEHPCEFCGENPEGYVEIPKVPVKKNETLEDFISNIGYLEMIAAQYAMEHPGTDPLALVLNYMRTAVPNYTTGSWAIMAGPEDKDFLKYVQEMEDAVNADPNITVWVNVSGLKLVEEYVSPTNEMNHYSGNPLRIMGGHFFGTMDMTYHNKGSQNHADVGGWVGDLVDLLSTSDEYGVDPNLTLEEKVAFIRENYLFKTNVAGAAGSFGSNDLYADLDAYYFMNELIAKGYNTGDLAKMMQEYFQSGLNLEMRFSYLLNNRLDALSTRKDLRTAVYNTYTSNKLITTLEGTRTFEASGSELMDLRKAVCYAFADEMCSIAGDYVEDLTNPRFTVFDSETKILAPGISQQINYATNADGNQIVYYVATADIGRDDVGMWVNYYDRDPGTPEKPQWRNVSVPNSAQNAQDRYGDPESADYIENFNVIASTNAGGFDMSDVATPGGLLVMNGVEWHPQKGSAGFFAILKDGTAYMGSHAEYESMKGQIQEAIGGFGEFVVRDGKVTGSSAPSNAPRTAVGITATGRVVIMCIDGRQAPFSSGASLEDVGYIMKEAGCVEAINLDGGGSTTFVARQPGSDELTVMNRPSDGYPRNISTSLLLYSTAPSSTKFDHAVIESEYDYATINTPVKMTAAGVSPSGNAVDIPEGATWAVSNENWGSITEEGIFTAKRLGEVTVYLMLDGKEVGYKTMTITNPDQIYFEKNKVDAIYGSAVTLPLRARVGGKAIAINPNDVTITLSAPAAGTMDGFTFRAAESEIKTLSITAAINENTKASINVMLYKQGENSFDFDKATGGDRTFAWDRQVTNAKVEDGTIYNVIDPSKDMVTSYTFALDMTAIPIPERLEEMTYMLPGGTMEGATAWSFLLSLAQRISDLTWVKATVDFDDRFEVDYSNLKVLNDYFDLKSIEFDAATNTLTVTLNWIKQSQVIDEATANPLCLINGIKLTPKDGVWSDASKINVVTSGTIGYEIYMRASGLYSFAQKPENQAVFGLYPYRNPADTSDAGGYFRDTYAQLTDEYTLVNILKEGWVNEEGGFAYYVDGERLTGVNTIDGIIYDFGENGVNVGQSKYTGLFYDEEAKVYRYSYLGVVTSGWQMINNEWYYFESSTMAAATGKNILSHIPYEFEENGRLISGTWMNAFVGWRYYYGPNYYNKGWYKIDGEWYYFYNGCRTTGIKRVASQEISTTKLWYEFDENGICLGKLTGIVEMDGILYFVKEGKPKEMGLFQFEGNYYYSRYNGALVVNESYYAWKIDSSSELPKGTYEFGADGKMLGSQEEEEAGVSGIVDKDGVLYYYENGKPKEMGLFMMNGNYYYSRYNGALVVNESYYAWKIDSSSALPKGTYEFGSDGRMYHGIISKDGVLYYYENGKGVEKGLFQQNDYHYYAKSKGLLAVNEDYYAYIIDSSSALPKGTYAFGADGKMQDGIGDRNGVLYYFENGVGVEKGLFQYNGYHYYAHTKGLLIVDQLYYTNKVDSSSLLSKGTYEFAADGKIVGSCATGEIVNKNGTLYYYENGKGVEKGLFYFDGSYYFAKSKGMLVVGESYYAWKLDETCALPKSTYEFATDGRMLHGIVDKNGILYYYENGKPKEMGLFQLDGSYYYSRYNGQLVVNDKYYAWKLDDSCLLPKNTYEFGADGKMLQGIVEKDGVLYYYENGNPKEMGLFCYEGSHYNSRYNGQLVVNESYYTWRIDSSSELPKGTYEFDAEGKLIGSSLTGEIVNKNGVLYYYEAGRPVDKGLLYLDGHYYFTLYTGALVVNRDYYVWRENPYLVVDTYTFNELGQIVDNP